MVMATVPLVLRLFSCFLCACAHMIYRDEIPNSLNIERAAGIGHVSSKGGGSLNSFGQDFKKHNYKWSKELCELDSDGDGKTNGEELGDPCCMWSPGENPSRVWAISHPGDVYKTTYMAKDPVVCRAQAQQQLQKKRKKNTGDPEENDEFWKFYFTADSAQKDSKSPETIKAEDALKKKSLQPIDKKLVPCGGSSCSNKFMHSLRKSSFGGSCTQCSVTKLDVLSCRCQHTVQTTEGPKYKLSWSVCKYDECFSRGTGIDNGIGGELKCSTGLNYCLTTHDYDRHIQQLEDNKALSSSIPTTYVTKREMSENPDAFIDTVFETSELAAGRNDANGASGSGILSDTHTIATAITIATVCFLMWNERKVLTSFRGLASSSSLRMFVISVFYVDLLSGLLHITLDNPTITHWPLIGPECSAFQGHHVTPNDIVRTTWGKHLSEAHFVHAILNIPMFLNLGNSSLCLFCIYANFNAVLMMAAHRWSHMNPHHLPAVIQWLQHCGALISTSHHSRHHVSYTENFAIFTGWSNPALNYAVKHWLSPYSITWVAFFVLWMVLPLPLSLLLGRKRQKGKPVKSLAQMKQSM